MNRTLICTLLILSIITVSCHKSSTNPGIGPNSLLPLVPGNNWIYKDSVFNTTGFQYWVPDTVTITSATMKDSYGSLYYMISDPMAGLYQSTSSYVSVDPSNYLVYEADSPSFSPYIHYEQAQTDGQLLEQGSDYSNPGCPIQYNLYGFATPVSINGNTSYKNIQYAIDCNGITREATVMYSSPGVGFTRMEDWSPTDSTGANLFMDYSQTLVSKTLK